MLSTNVLHPVSNPYSVRFHRGDITILLVDDDSTMLAVLKEVLTHEGYQVIAAASPTLALELAATHAFNMLVTDYQMPEMDGFVLANRLAKGRTALPVLVLSGSNLSEFLIAEIAERHWNFMAKPVNRTRLLRIIDGECLGWALRVKA